MESSLSELEVVEGLVEKISTGDQYVDSIVNDPTFHKLKAENLKSVEDIALLMAALQFSFQEGHAFYDRLKERDLL